MLDAPYPALGPAVARLRRSADRHAHGTAVLAAIRALQARELAREVPDAPIHCASGTRHQDGTDILAAIRGQHAATLSRARCRERDDAGWRAAYAEAMAERRAAASTAYEVVEKIDMAASPATHARPASVRAAPMLILARTIVVQEINTALCQVRATECVAADPAPASYIPAHIPSSNPQGNQTRKPRRSVNQPPRPATLPPAATVARTWMTGTVGVSFAIGG